MEQSTRVAEFDGSGAKRVKSKEVPKEEQNGEDDDDGAGDYFSRMPLILLSHVSLSTRISLFLSFLREKMEEGKRQKPNG